MPPPPIYLYLYLFGSQVSASSSSCFLLTGAALGDRLLDAPNIGLKTVRMTQDSSVLSGRFAISARAVEQREAAALPTRDPPSPC